MQAARWLHSTGLVLTLALVGACEPPLARSVPAGPSAQIALDVAFFIPVLGRWATDSFSRSIRDELAHYAIDVVARDEGAPTVAVITLGSWTDRAGFGRSITVELMREGRVTPAGRLRVPDLDTMTLDVAAQYVAVMIAQALRGGQRSPLVSHLSTRAGDHVPSASSKTGGSLAMMTRSRCSARRKPSRWQWSRKPARGRKYPATSRKATGLSCSPSWDQVSASNVSSSVPYPPGSTTNASARSLILALRSCMLSTT